jgi:1-deoxy-D-xylulose-5-phosphate synthase
MLAQSCADSGVGVPVRAIGVPRAFVEHGTRAELLDAVGLSGARITAAVQDMAAGLDPVVLGSGS